MGSLIVGREKELERVRECKMESVKLGMGKAKVLGLCYIIYYL